MACVSCALSQGGEVVKMVEMGGRRVVEMVKDGQDGGDDDAGGVGQG
jgi:hypothetical protein